MLLLALIAATSFLLASGSAQAVTIRVPADQPTIQAGLNAAASGDTVLVSPGTYTGPANRNLNFSGKAIVLRASGGPQVTTIDGQLAARLFDFHTAEPPAAAVEGFTLRRGSAGLVFGGAVTAVGASPTFRNCTITTCDGNEGGGMYFEGSSSRLESCSFTGNSAANGGGALKAVSSPLVLTGCSMSGNTAAQGAGVYAFGNATVSLTQCTFTNNDAANSGGAVYAQGSTLDLEDCTVSGSDVNYSGGAIFVADGSLTASGCEFEQNKARFHGGAIDIEDSANLTLGDCSFTSNSLALGGNTHREGGAVYAIPVETLSLQGCTFAANSTSGIAARGGACMLYGRQKAAIVDCTFTGNTSERDSGGGYFESLLHATMTGCVFTDNESLGGGGFGGGGAFIGGFWNVTDCTFINNTTGSVGGGVISSAGNGPIVFDQCTFGRNHAAVRGGGSAHDAGYRFTNCTWHDNVAPEGGGVLLGAIFTGGSGEFSHCTLVRNGATFGSGVSIGQQQQLTVHHTIIAGSTAGEAVTCAGASLPAISCSDIYGNAGGDWTGCIADQLGINGCFSTDPLFCNPGADDFTLAAGSPCAPAHSPAGCGLIGAYPVGCASPIGIADPAGAPPAASVLRLVPNPLVGDNAGMVFWRSGPTPGARPELKLYAADGRLLVAHPLPAGDPAPQALSWSAIGGDRELPSGVYFMTLESGEIREQTVRVVIVR
jgi:predicted outer membrane repeat protein